MKNKSLKNLYSWVVQPVSSLRTPQQLLLQQLILNKIKTFFLRLLKVEIYLKIYSPWNAIVPGTTAWAVVMSTLREQSCHWGFILKNDVQISFRWRGRSAFSWPLNSDRSKRLKSTEETLFCDIPWNSTQKHLWAVQRILKLSWWQLSRPSARGIIDTGGIPLQRFKQNYRSLFA